MDSFKIENVLRTIFFYDRDRPSHNQTEGRQL